MPYRCALSFVLFLCCTSLAPAHDTIEVEDADLATERLAMFERYQEFGDYVEGGTVNPHWLADGHAFWFAEGAPDETVIWKVDPAADTREPLFDTPRLREALAGKLGHQPAHTGLPFETFAFVDGEASARFSVEGRDFVLDLESYAIEEVEPPSPTANAHAGPKLVREGFTEGAPPTMEVGSPDGRWFATEQDDDIWLRSPIDGRLEQLTKNGEPDYSWSVSGASWSPSGFQLAAQRGDTRDVPRLPILYWLKTTEDVRWAPLAKAGQTIPRGELAIIDVLTKKVVPIEGSGIVDHYYNIVGWRNDGSEVLFHRMSRTFQKLELLAANARTGKSRVVLTETRDTFIYALQYAMIWQSLFTPVGDGERFVWMSQRSGWNQLYLYDFDGTLERRLTDGDFSVLQVIKIDKGDSSRDGTVYFTAHGEPQDPYATQLYSVKLGGGKRRLLTDGPGQHTAQFSPAFDYFLDTHATQTAAPRTDLRKTDGTLVRTLATADVSRLAELAWTPAETFVAKAADGVTDLHGVIYKPWNFDPDRRYPVLDYIYNGPFITWVPRTMTDARATGPRAMAQLGYVVFMVDGRGTPERGKAFQDVVYKQFGTNEIPDHAAALESAAATRPWMDLDRVGIYGGSWGGYMTTRALVTHPETYHAGVAVNPVYDHYDHNAYPIEGYMGLPQDNREAYEASSSIKLADRLQGKLLLVHGALDTNATFSATMKMVAALIAAGKQHDLIVLPDSTHWPRDHNADYLQDAQRLFFGRHLHPERIVPAEN